jgi:hypothetical protein
MAKRIRLNGDAIGGFDRRPPVWQPRSSPLPVRQSSPEHSGRSLLAPDADFHRHSLQLQNSCENLGVQTRRLVDVGVVDVTVAAHVHVGQRTAEARPTRHIAIPRVGQV